MADDDCDLDALTAMLNEDSDLEEDNSCEKKSQSQSARADDDEVDLDAITSFLEESESEEEDEDNSDVKPKEKPMSSSDDEEEEEGNTNNQGPDVQALQVQLLMMQKQMAALQQQLSQQTTPSPSSSQTKSPSSHKPHKKHKTSPSRTKDAKKTPDCKQDSKRINTNNGESSDRVLSRLSAGDSKSHVISPPKTASDKLSKKQSSCVENSNLKKSNNSEGFILDRLLPQSDSEKKSAGGLGNRSKVKSPKTPSQEKVGQKSLKQQKGDDYSKSLERNPFFDEGGPSGLKQIENDLKLDSDDSDFEGLDGEEKRTLSEEGKAIHSLLKQTENNRVSHVTTQDVSDLRNRAAKSSWKEKPRPVSSQSKPADVDSSVKSDSICGINIINPLVSSYEMKRRLQDRTLIKVSRIASRIGTPDLQGNWVTIGVVVSKTEPRTSSSGKTFCIWKLSDLGDCDKTVSFFLFGEVYKQLWKNNVKSVIGILNPSIMDKAEKVQQDVAFTVNHPQQVLLMGYSKDIGICSGISKAGKPCSNFINKQQGDRCTYHVQAAYRKTSSKRTELQGSYSGMTPKSEQRKLVSNKNSNSFFFYGGETFTSMRPKSKKDNISLKNLQQKHGTDCKGKITTMSLHQLDPEDEAKLEALKEKKEEFMEMLTTPTVGSMNLVKHLVKKEKQEKENTGVNKTFVQSVSAKDLLKEHKSMIKQKMDAAKRKSKILAATPTLGKGCDSNGLVFLDSPRPKLQKTNSTSDLAKRLAIAKVANSGGINKGNPNAVKKKMSPEAKQKIKKRVAECLTSDEKETASENVEPPKKRSKLLGNVDLDSKEVKELMKARSKHKGALAEVEAEHEERYFNELEKKEKYEDKMMSIMETKCKVFTCQQCQYSAQKPSDRCKSEGHKISVSEAKRRFFKCKKCGNRCTSLQKYPTDSCQKCGSQSFERTSMYQERKVPKLASEELCIRGDEIKYLGSMQEKVFLNS